MFPRLARSITFYWQFLAKKKALESLEQIHSELALQRDRIQEQKQEIEQAFSRIRDLNGLLPMCSSCRKIRDDRGYWSEVEAYISDHSDANFTHGICPSCAEKLYPGIDG